MRRKVFLAALVCIFLMAGSVVGQASEKPPICIVDGKTVVFNESTGFPYISDTGRTMMPVRVCLNAINCEVIWNQEAQTVLLNKDNIEVEIPIGKKEIIINKIKTPVDTAAIIKNGRAYLPLRAVVEAFGYTVNWDGEAGIVSVTSNTAFHQPTPANINGGSTGIFSRKQLKFDGFDGVQADITLPMVTIAEKGDCPYVYFGFDWTNDVGNAEGGFQFIEDSKHPYYNKWTVCMRQNDDWRWGDNIYLDQGSTHHLKFYSEKISEEQVDLVIELDGKEIIRKASAVADFSSASVKAVTSMAMSKPFDGTNCPSKTYNSKIANLTVSVPGSDEYLDFNDYALYSEWKPAIGTGGTWFGTAECIPSYLHYGTDGSISIYKEE